MKFIVSAERDKPTDKDQVWLVFMKIADCIGYFRAGRASYELPVHGLSTGYARYPLGVLRRLMEGLKSAEVELGFSDRFALCGKNEETSDQIDIGLVLNEYGEVLYPTQMEQVVIGRALSRETAGKLGISKLLEGVESRMRNRVTQASYVLEGYGVAPGRVEELVEQAISSADAEVRARFDLHIAEMGGGRQPELDELVTRLRRSSTAT